MTNKQILSAVELAIREDKKDCSYYPDQICAAAGRITAAAGALASHCDTWKYHKPKEPCAQTVLAMLIENDAVRVAAQAIRFLQNLKEAQ